MHTPTGELQFQTLVANTFCYNILCILQTWVETTGGYNTTTHQMTSLLPRMLHSMLKATKQLQFMSYNPVLTLLSHYFCAQVHVHKATNIGLYYTPNNHFTTNDMSVVQVEMNYDFWFVIQCVNPFFVLLQWIQCTQHMYSNWIWKISYSSDLLGSIVLNFLCIVHLVGMLCVSRCHLQYIYMYV